MQEGGPLDSLAVQECEVWQLEIKHVELTLSSLFLLQWKAVSQFRSANTHFTPNRIFCRQENC